jgi:hypothetical protein
VPVNAAVSRLLKDPWLSSPHFTAGLALYLIGNFLTFWCKCQQILRKLSCKEGNK